MTRLHMSNIYSMLTPGKKALVVIFDDKSDDWEKPIMYSKVIVRSLEIQGPEYAEVSSFDGVLSSFETAPSRYVMEFVPIHDEVTWIEEHE